MSRYLSSLWLCLALFAGACEPESVFSGTFDTPGALALLKPVSTHPFQTQVGYTADRHRGRIRILDLEKGTYLSSSPSSPYARSRAIGLGSLRILNSVAAASPTPDTSVVFATDTSANQLVIASHVLGVDAQGDPVEVQATLQSVQISNPDGQGVPIVEVLGFDRDRATDEVWQLAWDGQTWTLSSPLSGQATLRGRHGLLVAPGGSLTLRLGGDPTPGDGATLVVSRPGISVIDLPGTPQSVAVSPDGQRFVLSHTGPADDPGNGVRLQLGSTLTREIDQVVSLPIGAKPGRIDFDVDGRAIIADSGLPGAWIVDPTTGHQEHIELPWPTFDVAAVRASDGSQRLVVVPVQHTSVWLYDLDRATLIDINAATPEIDGIETRSAISGVAGIDTPYDFPYQRDMSTGLTSGVDLRGTSAAIALASGRIIWMDASTGCLVADEFGARTDVINSASSLSDYTANFNVQQPGTAYLRPTPDTARHVQGSTCAGITPTESWFLTYNAVDGGWDARGTVSGPQEALVVEGKRYVSDQGQISLLIQPGITPSEDSWQIGFNMLDGALYSDGTLTSSSVQNNRSRGNNFVTPDGYVYNTASSLSLEMPGDPIIFVRRMSGSISGHIDLPEVVVAAQSADIVVRVDPRSGVVDGLWD